LGFHALKMGRKAFAATHNIVKFLTALQQNEGSHYRRPEGAQPDGVHRIGGTKRAMIQIRARLRYESASAPQERSVAKDATVAPELAEKFKTEKDSPYLRFVRGEGLEVISAQYVPNLRTVELKPWARKNGKGVFINHEASRTSNDCYVCEIAPGSKLAPQH